MKTYNQVIKVLSDIAAAHQQVETFGEGDVWDIAENTAYPLMYVTPQPGSLNIERSETSLSLSIIFADLAKEDKSNEAEVRSDMQQVAFDVLAQLQLPAYVDLFTVNPSARLTPFSDAHPDRVTGWVLELTLRMDYLSDWCIVPSTLTPGTVVGCPTVNVYDSTGSTLLATVAAGGAYIVTDSRINDIEGTQIASILAQATYTANLITVSFTQSTVALNAFEAMTFTDQTTAVHNEYHWDFGDGTYSTSQNPTKTYFVAGTYSVTLTVANSANNAAGALKKTNLIVVANNLFLDVFTGADVAYSFRKLRAAYAGSVNRVYNGSGQQDIGFVANQYDEATFTTFIGTNIGSAAKWYDQSANARDLIQAATTAMPRVELSRQNLKPGLVFDGLTDYMDATGVATPNGKTIYLVSRFNLTDGVEQALYDSIITTQHALYKSTGALANRVAVAFGVPIDSVTSVTAVPRLYSVVHNGASSEVYRNGTLIISGNIGSNAFNGLRIGAFRGAAALFYNGLIFEMIVFPTVHSTATRQAVETAINTYWAIY